MFVQDIPIHASSSDWRGEVVFATVHPRRDGGIVGPVLLLLLVLTSDACAGVLLGRHAGAARVDLDGRRMLAVLAVLLTSVLLMLLLLASSRG